MTEPIVIEQDYEIDDDGDGEVRGPLNVFWTEGHGHDEHDVIRSVVDHCLDEGHDIPRIDGDNGPVEMWQTTRRAGEGAFFYVRADTRDELPSYTRASDIVPITLLDLDARRRGAIKCAIRDCREPWNMTTPIRVVTRPGDGGATVNDPHMNADLPLCRGHRERLPEPYYRVCLIPVGATIQLPPAGQVAS